MALEASRWEDGVHCRMRVGAGERMQKGVLWIDSMEGQRGKVREEKHPRSHFLRRK